MKKSDKLGLRLAHCLAMKQAAIAAKSPMARDYWFDQAEKVRRELQAELYYFLDGKPAPEQLPLITSDLKVDKPARKKSTKR